MHSLNYCPKKWIHYSYAVNSGGVTSLIANNTFRDNKYYSIISDAILATYHASLTVIGNQFNTTTANTMQFGGITALVCSKNLSDGTGTAANFYYESIANGETVFENNIFGNGRNGLNFIEQFINPVSGTISPVGNTRIIQYAGTGALTLSDGTQIGQKKLIYMDGFGSGASLVVTPANLYALTRGTFNADLQAWELMWNGSKWVTLMATCVIS